MSSTIDEFRQEHVRIGTTLEEVRRLGIGSAGGPAALAVAFFEKHSAASTGLDFARDFGRLAADLSQRIHREESLLYPEFERRAG